jgi:hypothetical protein
MEADGPVADAGPHAEKQAALRGEEERHHIELLFQSEDQ